ncbi:hypothetical protein G6F46_015415 [Rhizopus delemar]|nr:hypothetical protein G6F46_015415 [Rhizopus delemar]
MKTACAPSPVRDSCGCRLPAGASNPAANTGHHPGPRSAGTARKPPSARPASQPVQPNRWPTRDHDGFRPRTHSPASARTAGRPASRGV